MVDLNAINEAIAKHGVRLESDATRSTLPLTVRLVPLKRDFGAEAAEKMVSLSGTMGYCQVYERLIEGTPESVRFDLSRVANAAIRECLNSVEEKCVETGYENLMVLTIKSIIAAHMPEDK